MPKTLRRPIGQTVVLMLLVASGAVAIELDVLQSSRGVPAHISGRFRDAAGFQQSEFGQYYIFDRRGHTVYGLDEAQAAVWEIVQIGAEPGRIIEPTGFSVARDGTFAVADSPGNRDRIQVFSPVGFRIAGFTLSAPAQSRIRFGNVVLSGIATLQYTGSSILISQPENGSLVTEFSLNGQTIRSFGTLRATAHEDNRDVHLALNSGIPLPDSRGGFWFVFQAGVPVLRKFDQSGELVFERRIEGREIDPLVAKLPTVWTKRTPDGRLPLVEATVRTAAVDHDGRLWISFAAPFTYVYDRDGDKIRAVQFRAAGLLSPGSLFFGPPGTVLVTPGLFEFNPSKR